MNVLVVKELYDQEEVTVYELPEDEEAACIAASKIFDSDLELEIRESAVGIDENNTYWDEVSQTGQIQWNSMDDRGMWRRATYDVVTTTKRV